MSRLKRLSVVFYTLETRPVSYWVLAML